MYRYLFITFFIVLCAVGCESSKKGLSDTELERIAGLNNVEVTESAGQMTLKVGGEIITADQLIHTPTDFNGKYVSPAEYLSPATALMTNDQFKARYRDTVKSIIMSKISNIVLYQCAKQDFEKNKTDEEQLNKAAQSELRRFELKYDGDQGKVNEALAKMNTDRNGYLEQQKKLVLIQWYLSNQMNYDDTPVTYRVLKEQYDQIKDEFFALDTVIQFRLIDIQPARLSANEDAQKLAWNIMSKIKTGEDFGELAKKYSSGTFSSSGGLWTPLRPESLASPYDWIGKTTQKMKPGEVSEPHITAEHIFILKLENKNTAGYKPFEQVQQQVKDALVRSRRNDALDKLDQRLIQQTNLGQTDKFVDFCLEEIYRTSKQ